jgi:WD40 repeat protein
MIGRILVAVACLLLVAVAACFVLVFIAQRDNPPATKMPRGGQPVVAKKSVDTKPVSGKTEAAKEPQPSIPGGPEEGKSYSLAEAEKAREEARVQSLAKSEFREGVNAWDVLLSDPIFTNSNNHKEHIEKLRVMAEGTPNSPTLMIATAQSILLDAWRDRTYGPAEMVTESDQLQFRKRVAEARKLLEQAIEIGVKDPEAHSQLLQVASIEGWPLAETRALFEAGRKIDRGYSALYDGMAEYLLPRWHGRLGDVERFATEMAESMPGDDGLDALIHVAYVVNQFDGNVLYWGEYDRALLSQGAEVAIKRYPGARNLVPFAALCTTVAQDRAAARRVRPAVKHDNASRVLLWEHVAADFHRWCEAKEIDEGKADWIWGTPLNYPSLTFAADSRSLWCATGLGGRAAALWNLGTKKVELALDAGGSSIGALVVDGDKKWVAATLQGENQAGWMLWDLNNGDAEPFLLSTREACEDVAIDPKSARIVFAVGETVRVMDVPSKTETQPMVIGQRVTGVRFSGDGQSLAVTGESFSVWDCATAKKRYDLPTSGQLTIEEFACEKIVEFDKEGRVWAVGYWPGSSPAQRCLVRFSADGRQFERVVENLHVYGPVLPLTAVLSPDCRRLAICDQLAKPADGESVQVWDIGAGKIERLIGHHNHIGSIAFSPDGTKLATVSQTGGPLKIWSLPTLDSR